MSSSDQEQEGQERTIVTEGSAYIEGSVTISGGGSSIGHDAHIGYTADQVRALIAEIRRTDQPKTWDGRIPFKGLNSFREADTHFFFGHEALVGTLLERMRRVTEYIQNHLSFVVFRGEEPDHRKALEQRIISVVSLCEECGPERRRPRIKQVLRDRPEETALVLEWRGRTQFVRSDVCAYI